MNRDTTTCASSVRLKALAGIVAFAAVFAIATALPVASPHYAWASDLQTGDPSTIAPQASPDTAGVVDAMGYSSSTDAPEEVRSVESEGERFCQAVGTTCTYDFRALATHEAEDDWRLVVTNVSNGAVSYVAEDGYDGWISVAARSAGVATFTCTETWREYLEIDDPYVEDDSADADAASIDDVPATVSAEAPEPQETYVDHAETHTFAVEAVTLENTSGALAKNVKNAYASKKFTFKISGLPAGSDVELVSDSNKKGNSYVTKVGAGKVTLSVYGVGKHKIKLNILGKTVKCKATLRLLSLKKTRDVKDTGSLVAYPGMKSALAMKLTGVKKPRVKWVSMNKRVATVSKRGIVKAKSPGRCYLKAKSGKATVKVLVEVTTPEGYWAVRNGFADMRKALRYSQSNRMDADCRDCSSFVSRCYWDGGLGRYLFAIGGDTASSWALTAAGQAEWLNDQGKRVSWSACSAKKLRPGDTIYFETDYAGKDASRWRYIDHAALYVGNGLYLNTGGQGGKGTVGLAMYQAGSSSVKFIGRPCP